MADSASGVTDNPVIAVQLHGEDEQDVRNISVVQDAAPDNVPQNVPVSVSNADINVKLGDGRSLIFNTLLTFCVSAMSNALKMNVVQLIVMKFSENEVIAAKDVMCKNSDNMLQFQSRKESQYRSEKFVHSEDIYDGLKSYQMPTSCPYLLPMVLECPGCPRWMLKISQMYLSLRRSLLLSENLPRLMNP